MERSKMGRSKSADAGFVMRSRLLRGVAAAASLLLAATWTFGCQQGSAPEESEAAGAAPVRVENAALGMAIADLPGVFSVAANDGAVIELTPADPATTGRLRVYAGEAETGGINLVAAVKEHEAAIGAREGGEYKGQRELGSQLGTAFYSRGHYPGADGAIEEETTIFLVHPWQDRTLQLTYIYPAADDSKVRIEDHLFGVLGELEALATSEEDPAGESGG